LTNFGGVKAGLRVSVSMKSTHGDFSANDQIAGTGDAVQICVEKV
jgi:hypothetical protein